MMNALTVLLLCIAAVHAVPVHFPAEKTVIYDYYAYARAGIIEPAQYISQFALSGQLHIKRDISDPSLNNAYYVKLNSIKYGLYNGMVVHDQPIEMVHELGEAAQQVEEPFVTVYDEYGKFQGIKVPETESVWSRNIKQGIASMLQLDLAHIQPTSPIKPHSFLTRENTIHGNCHVSYNVQSENPMDPAMTNVFVVTKFHEMKNCSHFAQRVFDHIECEKCHIEPEDDMSTSARRVFHIEQQGNDILIKNLTALSSISYFPYNARAEAHYLLTNTSLNLHSVVPVAETPLSVVNFQNVPLIRDVTFNKPVGNYALHAAEDLTHGRHTVKLDALIPKLKKMLTEAADYLEENHMEAEEPEWKHGQTINRLQHTMSYMDLGSLEQVYNAIQDAKTPKEVTIKNIFLGMIPTVGTSAACHFTRNVIQKHKVTDATAMMMLIKLPMHVKVPSERLLLEMEELLKLDSTVSPQVKKTSILCFSILIRKTFMQHQVETVIPLLKRYIDRFLDHVMNEQTYEMKMVYLMAMKNVQVGNIQKFLEPIIRNPQSVDSDRPHHIRVEAIWAITKAIADKPEYTYNLLWPIFTDVTQPLAVRIAAYDVLMSQMPHLQRLMNIYWFMVHEQNDHLYHYHFTTLKGLANSVDPCLRPVREMVRKVMRYTRIRPVTTHLSSKHFVDYNDPKYGHGESWNTAWILDESTGLPHAGYVEHRMSFARKPFEGIGIYWNVYGVLDIMTIVMKEMMGSTVESLSNKNVQDILVKAAQDMPTKKPVHVDIGITLNGQMIMVQHYNEDSLKKLFTDLHQVQKIMSGNFQEIMYDTFYEMQVPTDMGMQAVLSTKLPQLWSFKFSNMKTEVKKPSLNLKLEADTRFWKHGEYAMSMYNPIADVWHSIRRATAQDIALPIRMNFNYNPETKNLKVIYPRLPITKMSHTGVRNYAKTLVTITEDEQDLLKKCCATCNHQAVVTTGDKRNHQIMSVDSKDLGLKHTVSIFDCENEMTPTTYTKEYYRVMSPEHKNTWGSKLMQYVMGTCQKITNDYLSPRMGNCGMLSKTEPSIAHPTSHVELSLRMNVDNVDHLQDKMHFLNSKKINIRGTLDAKAASTNESVRSWDANMNINMSQGHVLNNMKLQMKRVTPGEKNLKICVDAQKSYSVMKTDVLKVDTNEETNTKITITAGFMDDDKSVRDEMVIAMTIKGEMTEEQKKQMMYDSEHGDCTKDMRNPQFQTQQGYVAKTVNCVHEVIKYGTMRKYTINASYKKVPVQVASWFESIEDQIRATHLPYVNYVLDRTENGNMKMVFEIPTDRSHFNATVVTPFRGYEYVEVPMQQELYNGMVMNEPVSHPGWYTLLDNSHFTTYTMNKIIHRFSKICTVYPKVVITMDDGVIEFLVPNEWTLVSGDHNDQTYAIFAKSVQRNKLATKIYIAGHEMEIMPNESSAIVTVDGNVVDQHEKGIVVPKDEPESYTMKVTELVGHLIVLSQRVPMMIMWTPNTVTVMMDTTLQGRITGVCGHMDNTHKEKLPKVYTASV